MLQTLKKNKKSKKFFYGINSGNYGFLMNKFSIKKTIKNLSKARMVSISPLVMTVINKNNVRKKSIAINEVSILRQSRQAASISIKKGKTDIETGDRLKGTMTVDMKKPYKTNFKVLNIFDNGNLLLAPRGFPSIRSSQLIKVKLDNGISESFFMKGIDEVMEQSKSMCESPYLYEEEVEPKSKDMKVWFTLFGLY